jgi:hypothetical protein
LAQFAKVVDAGLDREIRWRSAEAARRSRPTEIRGEGIRKGGSRNATTVFAAPSGLSRHLFLERLPAAPRTDLGWLGHTIALGDKGLTARKKLERCLDPS